MGYYKSAASAVSVSRRLSVNYNLEKPLLSGECHESSLSDWFASAAHFDRFSTARQMTGWVALGAMATTITLGVVIAHYASELFRWYFSQA